jgi:hypothetical protein
MAAVGSVDVEVLLIGWLQEQLGPDVVVRDETDNALLDELPTVVVQRVGGSDDGLRLDFALADIDVYAATRDQALVLSSDIRGRLLALRGSVVGGAVIGRVRTESAPVIRPYENVALRRAGGTYSLYLHPAS